MYSFFVISDLGRIPDGQRATMPILQDVSYLLKHYPCKVTSLPSMLGYFIHGNQVQMYAIPTPQNSTSVMK